MPRPATAATDGPVSADGRRCAGQRPQQPRTSRMREQRGEVEAQRVPGPRPAAIDHLQGVAVRSPTPTPRPRPRRRESRRATRPRPAPPTAARSRALAALRGCCDSPTSHVARAAASPAPRIPARRAAAPPPRRRPVARRPMARSLATRFATMRPPAVSKAALAGRESSGSTCCSRYACDSNCPPMPGITTWTAQRPHRDQPRCDRTAGGRGRATPRGAPALHRSCAAISRRAPAACSARRSNSDAWCRRGDEASRLRAASIRARTASRMGCSGDASLPQRRRQRERRRPRSATLTSVGHR